MKVRKRERERERERKRGKKITNILSRFSSLFSEYCFSCF